MAENYPVYGENFLFAFDYKLPPISKKIQNILYIHSTRIDQSETILNRLMELFPHAKFYVLQRDGVHFSNVHLEPSNIFLSSGKEIPPDYHQTDTGKTLLEKEIDIVFFGVNLDIRLERIDPLNSYIAERYENILEYLKNTGLYDWTAIVDNQFCVYYPRQIEMDRVHGPEAFKMNDASMFLPWTFLSGKEKETLFQLAQSGPANGSIVNIGYFQGGSSIILAMGSKLARREKVFAFDIEEFPQGKEFRDMNQLEDWIIFRKEDSFDAAKTWGENKIRLLFIDGDHSYEGCKNDILSWTPHLASGGIIAIHDYGNVSQGTKYSEVVKAIYDTILKSSEFNEYCRIDTIFMAAKT